MSHLNRLLGRDVAADLASTREVTRLRHGCDGPRRHSVVSSAGPKGALRMARRPVHAMQERAAFGLGHSLGLGVLPATQGAVGVGRVTQRHRREGRSKRLVLKSSVGLRPGRKRLRGCCGAALPSPRSSRVESDPSRFAGLPERLDSGHVVSRVRRRASQSARRECASGRALRSGVATWPTGEARARRLERLLEGVGVSATRQPSIRNVRPMKL